MSGVDNKKRTRRHLPMSTKRIHFTELKIWLIGFFLVPFFEIVLMLCLKRFSITGKMFFVAILSATLIVLGIIKFSKLKRYWIAIGSGSIYTAVVVLDLRLITLVFPIVLISSAVFKVIQLHQLEERDIKWIWYRPINYFLIIPAELVMGVFLMFIIIQWILQEIV